MFKILPQSSEFAIGFEISGKVTAADYDYLLPKLDEAIATYGKINLLVVMGDFKGWDALDAAKDDFKFGTHQYRQVEKTAFISDKKWQKWMIKIMDPLTRRTDERFFDHEQIDDGWQWIKKGI